VRDTTDAIDLSLRQFPESTRKEIGAGLAHMVVCMDQIIPSAFLAFVKASTEIQGISLFD
jgi:hypothetical protein